MNKTFVRIVSLLLVPCLLADPSAASLVHHSMWRAPAYSSLPAASLQTQAIIPILAVCLTFGSGMDQRHPAFARTVRVVQAARRRKDDDSPPDPDPAAAGLTSFTASPVRGRDGNQVERAALRSEPLTHFPTAQSIIQHAINTAFEKDNKLNGQREALKELITPGISRRAA